MGIPGWVASVITIPLSLAAIARSRNRKFSSACLLAVISLPITKKPLSLPKRLRRAVTDKTTGKLVPSLRM